MKVKNLESGMNVYVRVSDLVITGATRAPSCDDPSGWLLVTVESWDTTTKIVSCNHEGKGVFAFAHQLRRKKPKTWKVRHGKRIHSLTKRVEALEDYMHSEQLRRKIIESYPPPLLPVSDDGQGVTRDSEVDEAADHSLRCGL